MRRPEGVTRGPVGRRSQPERGATLVEFAIVCPVLFLLLFALADFSLILIANSVGGNAAREGARAGILSIECADSYAGSPAAGHDGCATPGAAYLSVTNAVNAKLAGMLRGTPTVEVRCLDGTNASLASPPVKNCTQSGSTPIVPDVDLIEVKVTWSAIGSSPFVPNTTHHDLARMRIVGAPR